MAYIVPIPVGRLAELVRAGLARPAQRSVSDLGPTLPPAGGGKPSLEDLLAQARSGER